MGERRRNPLPPIRPGDLFATCWSLLYWSGAPRSSNQYTLEAGSIILILDDPYTFVSDDKELRVVEVLHKRGRGVMVAAHFDLTPGSTKRLSK